MKINKSILQMLKYGIVGVSNTLLTAIVIWIMLKKLNTSDYFANITGYIVGLTNSFIWNRKWTFESKSKVRSTIVKFIAIFVISYLFQLGALYLLLHYTTIDSYICQLMSIVAYTGSNFFLNKYYTFKA
ncbi:MAG TPA: GtrA family protein [Paludibacter sp.]|nr:GtrA family protein [Paludibacter sp.]